jgi:sterol desaturase/sphingolipid hydroxylase (fatty acid hydroxylase superfamily)
MDSIWLRAGGSAGGYILLGVFLAVAVAEMFRPRRKLAEPTPRRWAHNTVLFGLNTLVATLVYRASGVVVAALVSSSSFGLLNRTSVPYAVRFALGFLAIDLLHYGQHTLYHRVGFLWRLHQVHHSDSDFDLTTGFRFHPGEALLTQGVTLGVIALLAPPTLAVLAVETVSQAQDLFEHANLALPARWDRILRAVLITPDMHRIHHSADLGEQNRNLGTIFPWWDRVFGTYLADPAGGQENMPLGLRGIPAKHSVSLWRTLAHPFQRG